MIMISMCGLTTSKSHLLYYEDYFIDHCITLVAYLHCSGRAIRIEYIQYYSPYKQRAPNQSSQTTLIGQIQVC